MDIRGVGTGPLEAGPAGASQGPRAAKDPEAAAIPTGAGADAVAGLLRELSASQIESLNSIIEPAMSPQRTAQVDQLVQAAVSAARAGDVNGSLSKLATVVSLDPRRADSVTSEPALAPIREDVEALLVRLTTAVRLDAETRLRDATQQVQAPGAVDPLIGNIKPATLLLLAGRLLEAGGYANWVHSAEVSQMVLDRRVPTPPETTTVEQLLRDAVSAARDGDVTGALEKLATLVALDPRRAEALASEPALAPIRKEVEALVVKLTATAQLEAEVGLRKAAQSLEAPGVVDWPAANVKPSTLLVLAARLIDAGGHANYIHSAGVSQMVVERRMPPAAPTHLEQLLPAAVSAAREGDVNGFLAKLVTVVSLDPRRGERLASEPALAPVRKPVEALVERLTAAAHVDAQTRLRQAIQYVQAPGARPSGDPQAPTLLKLAARLIEAGGYANCVHAAEIAQAVLDGRVRSLPDTTHLEPLLRAAVSVVSDGEVKALLARVAPPGSAEPALAPVRKEVEALVETFTAAARLDAESRLREAAPLLQTPRGVEPSMLVLLATQLIDAGGYANSLQSAGFSQMVIDPLRWMPAPVQLPLSERVSARPRTRIRREVMRARLKNLWRRAPLLVLLLGWLAVGLAGGSASNLFREEWPASMINLFFEIWALGFLALIGFQFYMRVRRR